MWIASKKRKKFILYAWIPWDFYTRTNENLVHSTLPAVCRDEFTDFTRFVFILWHFFHFRFFFSLHSTSVWLRRCRVRVEWLCCVGTFACVCIWKLCRIHIVFVWFNSIHLFALTILRSSCAFLRRLSYKLDHLPLSANIFFSSRSLVCLLTSFVLFIVSVFFPLPCECPDGFRLISVFPKKYAYVSGKETKFIFDVNDMIICLLNMSWFDCSRKSAIFHGSPKTIIRNLAPTYHRLKYRTVKAAYQNLLCIQIQIKKKIEKQMTNNICLPI